MNQLDQIQQAELQLSQAQLASDTDTLAQLLADDLIFVGPDGQEHTKEMDLATHRSGSLRLTSLVTRQSTIKLLADVAVVSVVIDLQGFLGEQPIGGAFRYLRVWSHREGRWQVIAGSCTPVFRDASDDQEGEKQTV